MSRTHFVCTTCQEEKPQEEFAKLGKRGLGRKCKPCINAYNRKWRTSEYSRNQNLKKSFGITSADYDEMFKAQGGVCKICKQPETTVRSGKIQSLSVDHNHTTGKIRGLLCNSCNRALGKFKDSKENLLNAIKYLEERDYE